MECFGDISNRGFTGDDNRGCFVGDDNGVFHG